MGVLNKVVISEREAKCNFYGCTRHCIENLLQEALMRIRV